MHSQPKTPTTPSTAMRSQGNPRATEEAAADGSRGTLAQGDTANERHREERSNGYGGDEAVPLQSCMVPLLLR